jgi:hypothetical protein
MGAWTAGTLELKPDATSSKSTYPVRSTAIPPTKRGVETRLLRGGVVRKDEKPTQDVPGWTFEVDEISAGAYRVRGTDELGRSVEATGVDPEALLRACAEAAGAIAASRN